MGLISIRFGGKDDNEYKYCMRTLANIREEIINESGNWRVGLREVLVKLCRYWSNGVGDSIPGNEGNMNVKPYYYTQEKLQELYNQVDLAKQNIGNVKNTEIERIMPEIFELEGEIEMLKVVGNIRDRNLLISLYDDYIKGVLTERIMGYLKNG